MRRIICSRRNPAPATNDILNADEGNSTPWPFVEGSIYVSASILMANAIARCAGWPVIGFFKNLTEQEDGVIIAGMALLFPTALVSYLGVKMVYAAYKDYKKWRDAWIKQAREEGRAEERARQKRELAEQGVSLPPETEKSCLANTTPVLTLARLTAQCDAPAGRTQTE